MQSQTSNFIRITGKVVTEYRLEVSPKIKKSSFERDSNLAIILEETMPT